MNIWSLIYRFACAVLGVVVLLGLIALFYPKIRQYLDMQKHEAQLAEDIKFDQELIQLLKAKQEKLQNDPRFLERVARDELGLARPGETVFKFVDDPAPDTHALPSATNRMR